MTNNQIVFRAIEDKDIEKLHELLNDFDTQQIVGGDIKPMSFSDVTDWLTNKRKKTSTQQFAVEYNGSFCGYIQLVNINKHDNHAIVGINFLKESRGKGIGKVAVQYINDFSKNKLLLNKVFINVRADNLPSINLFKSMGYEEVGSLKKHTKVNNGFVDVKIMEIIL